MKTAYNLPSYQISKLYINFIKRRVILSEVLLTIIRSLTLCMSSAQNNARKGTALKNQQKGTADQHVSQ